MRVISGSKRGMKLAGFDGEAIRPTTDRVKENIFNMIAPYVPDARALDLFAGTGALSIEAVSRGAAGAVLCESASASVKIIEQNLEKTGFSGLCRLERGDCFSFLSRNTEAYDLIFLDPPYNTGLLDQALNRIVQQKCLAADGIIVAECDGPEKPAAIKGLSLQKEKKYGRTYILIYTWDRGEQGE